MTIVAAADGSALGNPGPAGWAWYVDDDCWRAGGWPHGTNNMGELMAVLDLFLATADRPEEPLHILCDSQYVINSVTKWMPGWKRKGWRKSDGKPVLNVELLQQIDAAIKGRNYTFEWVKGHAGHALNEAADDRARAAATAFQAKRPPVAGPGFAALDGATSVGAASSAAAVASAASSAATTRPQGGAEPRRPRPAAAAPVEDAPEAEQLDLFASLDDEVDPAFTAADVAALSIIVTLEAELLEPEVRADAVKMGALLHPQFTEIGASGTLLSREDLLLKLAEDAASSATMEVLSLARIDQETALITYRTQEQRGSVLRSSLWQRERGRWQLRFHQGTLEP